MDVDEHPADGVDPEEGPESGTGDLATGGPESEDLATTDSSDGKSNRWIFELTGVVVVAIVVAFLLRTFVIATYSIPSGSMEPTLQIGDRIVVDKLSYDFHGVDPGNIVVFTTPPNEDCAGPPVSDLVKRVVGLPGQTISVSGGNVFINGRQLHESWLPSTQQGKTYPGPSPAPYALHHSYRIPKGDVYVMGDNRMLSCDSRYWGPIAESTIVGKVDLRIWPLSRLAFF